MEHCVMCVVCISVNDEVIILRSCFWEDEDTPQASCISNNLPSFVKIEFCKTCVTDGCNRWISKIWKIICNQNYVCILFCFRIALSKFNLNKLKTWINRASCMLQQSLLGKSFSLFSITNLIGNYINNTILWHLDFALKTYYSKWKHPESNTNFECFKADMLQPSRQPTRL